MILFQNDYARFPGAILDYETKNESFLRTAALLKQMGVKNNSFMLSLLQPELQGIDPHDENLSDDIKVKIGLEITFNYWYFVREVIKIPPISGPHPVPYKLNRANLALGWLFLNNIDVVLIQPRQTGKSVSTDCLMIWVLYFSADNALINLITKDEKLRVENVDRLKKIRDLLPEYLIHLDHRDSNNQTDLTYRRKGNRYKTSVGQNSESAANNLGRGLTSPINHIDEGPFIRFLDETVPAALSAGNAAREEAEKYARPYGNIFTTTAGKRDERSGKFMYNMVQEAAIMNEIFYDCANKAETIKLVKINCSGRKAMVNCTFSHKQLGYSDEWLYEKIVNSNSNEEKADRDYFNRWTSGTLSSPLSTEVNNIIKEGELDPVYNEITKEGYIIRWYLDEDELMNAVHNTHFVAGLDTSDAIGRDYIAMVIMDYRDMSVVGVATVNETNLIKFGKFLANFLIKYSNTILVPEMKSSARGIIDALLIHLPREGEDPFKRIYNRIVDEYEDREKEYREIQKPVSQRQHDFYNKFRRAFGFNTTSSSRDLLYSTVLQSGAKEAGHLVRDRFLSTEIRGLIVKNGRIDHSGDNHDDTVIAWLLAVWLLTQSKNLGFYGINIREVLTKIHQPGKTVSIEDELRNFEQARIKEEIEDIYEELTNETDEFMIARYESRLRSLSNKLVFDEEQVFSIDTLISQATELRQQKSRRRALEQRRKGGENQESVWARLDRRESNPYYTNVYYN